MVADARAVAPPQFAQRSAGRRVAGTAAEPVADGGDPEQAADSLRKLARSEPRGAWPERAEPITADVRVQLERAATI